MALCAQLSQPCVGKVAAHSRPAAFTAAKQFRTTRATSNGRPQRESSVTCFAAAAPAMTPELKRVALPDKDYHPSPLSQPIPETYAIIEVGGQQLFVEPGKWYNVNRLKAEEGSTIKFGRVLMYKGDSGVQFGTPYLGTVSVEAEVVEHLKGDKVIVYKMKPKKHTRKKNGHRQPLTKFMITKIDATAAEEPTASAADVQSVLQRVAEDKRAAVEKVLTGDDLGAAIRTAIRLR